MTTRTYTPEEYAAQLRVCVETVYRHIHRGTIKAERVGRLYRIVRLVHTTPDDSSRQRVDILST